MCVCVCVPETNDNRLKYVHPIRRSSATAAAAVNVYIMSVVSRYVYMYNSTSSRLAFRRLKCVSLLFDANIYYYDIGTFLYVGIEYNTRKVKCIYFNNIYNTIMYYCMLTVTLFDVINFFLRLSHNSIICMPT